MKNQLKTDATDVQKLAKLIHGIDIAMLTTRDLNGGQLHSRPMATQEMDESGDLWFFTDATSLKISEVSHEHHVNLTYADPRNHKFVSVSGIATLVADQDKMEELWKPIFLSWFPKGLDDPRLSLLRVRIDNAEYWDSPSSTVVKLIGFAKIIAGKPGLDLEGSHGKLTFPH